MKKRLLSLILAGLLIIVIPVTAYAATPRATVASPVLEFEGMTAKCKGTITSEPNNTLEAEIKLFKGSACVATWNASGTGFLVFNKSKTVTSKGEYTMTVSISINGVESFTVSDSANCT